MRRKDGKGMDNMKKKWFLRIGLMAWLVCSAFTLVISLGNRKLPGPQGIQGLQGIQGVVGEKGDTGEIGLRGFRGEKGERGNIGTIGLQGDKGNIGVKGSQGEKGDTWYNDLPKLYKQTSPAVVWIGAEYSENDFLKAGWDDKRSENIPITVKWQGTGFFVTPRLIATAGHVVENTKSFMVQFQDGSQTYADFVHMEKMSRCDVGFIKLRGDRCNSSYFNLDTEVEIGESLIILGYPWGLNNGVALTQGVVSLSNRSVPFFGVKLVMHTDTASYPGNSGSPVIDMDGECVGILIGGRHGCDNWSIVTRARLVELAMQKALAEIGLMEAK